LQKIKADFYITKLVHNAEEGMVHHTTHPSLEHAVMRSHCTFANGLKWVRGRSHSPSSCRKNKSLAEARNLFAGSQVVTHGMLRVLIPGV
jgi:hypothetical protein